MGDLTPAAGRDYGDTLWAPTAESAASTEIVRYARWLASLGGPDVTHSDLPGVPSYHDLWQWSVDEPGAFWSSIWEFFGVLGARGDGPVLTGQMPEVSWFPGTTLNYARNALLRAGADPGHPAVIYSSEAGREGRLSYGELAGRVAEVRAWLQGLGVSLGDRVAAYLPNSPEALIAMLATASLGAIWTSCSPDFGSRSVIDRFAQVGPKVLLGVNGYAYGGRQFDRRAELAAIAAELPDLAAVILVDYLGTGPDGATLEATVPVLNWDDIGADGSEPAELEFAEVPFSHPLWVLYSSGTTGLPKPIVHSHGGVVLEHLKALALHQDLTSEDTFFWYTTTGWMMWNYLIGGLLTGSAIVLYDGSAVHPDTGALWRLVAEAGVTYAGTGAPYLLACLKDGLRPAAEHDLSALKGVGSTGSPLPPEGFRWVYDELGTGSTGADSRLVLRRHRRVHGVRRAVSDPAGARRGDLRAVPRGQGRVVRPGRQRGDRRGGRACPHPADAVHAGRLLERPWRRALPVELFRRLSGRLAARRLDHDHARWRLRHLRPVGRHPEPRRGPDGHQRVLPGGGAAARGGRQPRRRYRPAGPGRPPDPVRADSGRPRARRGPDLENPRAAPG